MAARTASRPWRSLIALAVLVAGLAVWAFFPGTDHAIRLGLDLQGGTQVILIPRPVQEGKEITQEQLDQTVTILRQRVDSLGVAEAEVTTQGSGAGAAVVVSVPGANPDRLVDLVQRTALLDFRPVYAVLPPTATLAKGAKAGTKPVQAKTPDAAFETAVLALDCTNPESYAGGTPDDPTLWLGTCSKDGTAKYVLQPAFIKGTNVTSANAQLPTNGVGWVVSLGFDSEGAKALADASTTLSALPDCSIGGQSPCNAFAIVLDGVVSSAPRFNEPIIGGTAQIEGSFTAEQANDLANVLKYGALPVTLEAVDITSVSPTVGSDQLRAGIIAGLLGLALVMIYLFLYYRIMGLVAIFSLIIAAGITYLTFVVLSKTIGLTLTLAGVAGAIVAIGITADSFIVYFERIRDEIRDGRTLRQSVETGWIRARRTLLAADFISLLAAVVLYILSVGSVRGFAFVLGLTTVIDVVVAFLFTYPVAVLIGRRRWMQTGSRWTGLDAAKSAPVVGVTETLASRRRRAATQPDASTEEIQS
ncbi:MAG: protein translocase subunit SecD [Candidatus Nanopelagicales bacterium]|nr:protein translocase subunit SecD [Candidatus Nanopelagicales bacterium]